MTATVFFKQVLHVLKKLHMSALVTCDCNSLYVFLNSTFHNFCDRTIMPKMNDFCALALEDTPHNIYGHIMTIKKACGCYDTYFILLWKWHVKLTITPKGTKLIKLLSWLKRVTVQTNSETAVAFNKSCAAESDWRLATGDLPAGRQAGDYL